jgi:mono/diheme cytochrome c family protein
MRHSEVLKWTLGVLVAGSCGLAIGQPAKADVGKGEYMANCAACHGASGKGDGPYHNELKRPASDLTTLSKRNNGVFPVARMYDVIDGGGPGHGSREMPVFGQNYKVKAGEYFVDVPYDPEAYVRMRILSLIEYLSRIQVK